MKSMLTAMICMSLGAEWVSAAGTVNVDPSLRDTLAWLQGAVAQHANNGDATGAPCDSNRQNRPCRFKYSPVDFSGCSVSYQFEGQITIGNELRARQATVVVPLWELAMPQARREQDGVPTWLVPLSLREDARFPIRVREDADPNYLPGHRDYEERFVWLEFADFNTDNQAMAQRVARAFAHAIELCNGKASSGEPF